MMDLLATVPYYTAYLSSALLGEGVPVQVGSITYYLDPHCFHRRGIELDPGCLDVVGTVRLPRLLRQFAKAAETVLNLLALSVRFLFAPPDVIHVQFLPLLRSKLPLDAWFLAFCRRRGIRAVLTIHDLLPHDTAEIHKALYHSLYGRVDALICHSQHIHERLVNEFGVAPAKIATIPHGPFFYDQQPSSIEPTLAALGIERSRPIVLWQGIIFPYKGLDLLVDAWPQVEAQVPSATLVIVGTGAAPLLEQLRLQIERLGLKNVRPLLRFTTPEQLVALYKAADLVVYPYRAITTSGALATGLALGKAIVASDLPVFRELLTHGKDALLIDSGNSYDLSHAIVELLLNTSLRTGFETLNSRKNFGVNSWNFIARETIKVYKSVLIQT